MNFICMDFLLILLSMPKPTGYCPTPFEIKKKCFKNSASSLHYLVSRIYRSFCFKDVKEFLPDFSKVLYLQAHKWERGSEVFWVCSQQ